MFGKSDQVHQLRSMQQQLHMRTYTHEPLQCTFVRLKRLGHTLNLAKLSRSQVLTDIELSKMLVKYSCRR